MGTEKSVDVVIPTYRPGLEFMTIIERLKRQTVKVNNILIINTVNNSKVDGDVKKDIISFSQEKRYIKYNGIQAKDGSILTFDDDENTKISIFNISKEDFDHGATRDYGAALSDADYIVMMSQYAVPLDKKLLENLIRPFEDGVVGITYARQFASKKADDIEKFTKAYNFPPKDIVKSGAQIKDMGMHTYFCSNTCAAYKKSIYNEVGGFDVRAIFNEDVIMAAKVINVGYKVAYVSNARVRNIDIHTYKEKIQRNFDLGVSVRQFRAYFKVTKSELDSMDRIKATYRYLKAINKAYLIPKMIVHELIEWVAYEAGYNYEKLPNILVKKISSNKDFWKR